MEIRHSVITPEDMEMILDLHDAIGKCISILEKLYGENFIPDTETPIGRLIMLDENCIRQLSPLLYEDGNRNAETVEDMPFYQVLNSNLTNKEKATKLLKM